MRLTYVFPTLLVVALSSPHQILNERTDVLLDNQQNHTATLEARVTTECHRSKDDIGAPCQLSEHYFMRAATIYCRKFLDPFQLPTGQSYPYKISQIPCEEDTSLCDFYGNLRNDRDNGNVPAGYTFMDYDKCMEFMPTIFTACGGNGGWVNTDYGTVFAECIQVKS